MENWALIGIRCRNKIIIISIILVLISGIGVVAMSSTMNEVKIVFRNGYEMSTVTSKLKVSTDFCIYVAPK